MHQALGTEESQPAAYAAPAAFAFRINIEWLAWAALLAAGGALRIARLDHVPLTPEEATRSFQAFRVAEGTLPEPWPGDLTAALSSHLFRIFGDGDFVARILPALAGIAALALLWTLRRHIGPAAAFLAAGFLAFSPLAVQSSRSALPFAAGTLLALAMVTLLFAYIRTPRPALAGLLGICLGLSLGSDPTAVTAALALGLFLIIEASWLRSRQLAETYAVFRSSAEHWLTAALSLAGALAVSISHFGTAIDRLSLPGIRLWTNMFDLPHDSLPGYYHLGILLGYEWPLLFAGTGAFLALGTQAIRGRVENPFERFLLVWTALAALMVALSTRRESGQLLLLLLPMALLAGVWIQRLADEADWRFLARWWPALLAEAILATYAVLLLALWSRPGRGIEAGEQVLLAAAFTLVVGLPMLLVVNRGREAIAFVLAVAGAFAAPFLITTSMAIGFGGGTEFARDAQFLSGRSQLGERLTQLAAEQESAITLQPSLSDDAGWYLRGLPLLSGSPPANVRVYAAYADADAPIPEGFEAAGEPIAVTQKWYPESTELENIWGWFAYRQPYGETDLQNVQIYVRQP